MKPWAAAAAAYTIAAVAATWPLAAQLTSVLPNDPYDPALVTWLLWWNAHTLPLTAQWWNAPMFWPMHGALALSEHLLGISLLTTPLQWLGVPAAAAYNIAFLVSFPLVALAFHALLFALTRRHDAAAVGALAFAFGPYRMAQVAHLQMLWTFALPLALFALHRHRDTRQARWLVLFAAAWCVQALSNGYLLLFFPVLVALWVVWYVRDARQLAAIAAASLLGSLPLLPILLRYEQWHEALALNRNLREIQSFSADGLSIISTGDTARLWRGLSRFAHLEDQFFPGAVVLLLVAAGIVAATRRAPRSQQHAVIRGVRIAILCGAAAAAAAALSTFAIGAWTLTIGRSVTLVSVTAADKPLTIALLLAAIYGLSSARTVAAWRQTSPFAFFVLAAATMFVLALGPNPRVNGQPALFHSLYWWLIKAPGYSAVRVPARFGVLFELCLAAAASLAFARLTASLHHRTRLAVAIVTAAVALAEGWPEIALAPVPAALTLRPPDGASAALLELPLGYIEFDTAALWRAMQHRLPLVNGYSGYEPVHYTLLKRALQAGDPRVLDVVGGSRDLLVAIDRHNEAPWSELVSQHPRASRVAENAAWVMYRIRGEPPPVDLAAMRRLPVATVETTAAQDGGNLVDGDVRTTWRSGSRQGSSDDVTIDFGRECDVAALKLLPGGFDFPQALDVDCRRDGGGWQSCWRGSTAALALEGVLADPRHPTMTLRLDARGVRRIRLRGTSGAFPWSIAELSAFSY